MDDNWSLIVKDIITSHNKRKDDIQKILANLLDVDKMGFRCNFEITNSNKLIWNVSIATKTFTLTNDEILDRQIVIDEEGVPSNTDEKKDLEVVIKAMILEKIR